ncbi:MULTISPECIES: FMN-binding protein [Actinoplanes]|uniref:FMN-binding protein n=1 Tax=Actinoplanes TaxID=1865 RepID=UPI0005F278B1|nr:MULTISPECIES: FMN-binding protein [Actinoplanes]GLY00205.1 FMN-binding protein [Actinoplanes sp. NBRC 101535]
MRRVSLWMLSTVAALVLLFSYRTSTGTSAVTASSTVASSGAADGDTYTGDTVQTQEGDIQVVITVADGKITSVSVPVYPSGSARHEQISGSAVPTLVEETLAAQSADIDSVSGATYTSEGYKESLQTALDDAQLT